MNLPIHKRPDGLPIRIILCSAFGATGGLHLCETTLRETFKISTRKGFCVVKQLAEMPNILRTDITQAVVVFSNDKRLIHEQIANLKKWVAEWKAKNPKLFAVLYSRHTPEEQDTFDGYIVWSDLKVPDIHAKFREFFTPVLGEPPKS